LKHLCYADFMSLFVLGVMTGTSCDGLDAACVEFGSNYWELAWAKSAPYPPSLRQRVLDFQKPDSRWTSRQWLELDRDLGTWYAQVIQRMIRRETKIPHVIANHGQTIAHFPNKPGKGISFQLGDASRIATFTGISVVSHFREGDLAAGGQGAPLVPLFHQLLAQKIRNSPTGLAIHNLGGISNLTHFGREGKITAFDTGPGNIWIDAATERFTLGRWKFDKNGTLASQGTPEWSAVAKILKHPFFQKRSPKSTGRDEFPFSLLLQNSRKRGKDLVATATEITVSSIVNAYQSQILNQSSPLDTIYFCGGGAHNRRLLSRIQSELPQIKIFSMEQIGFNSQWIEAQAFAFFGLLSLLGIPLGGPWTGAKRFGSPGHIIPGKTWLTLVSAIHNFKEHLPSYLPYQSPPAIED
jgi:anhydro-N-acetylmuramic acid kinase